MFKVLCFALLLAFVASDQQEDKNKKCKEEFNKCIHEVRPTGHHTGRPTGHHTGNHTRNHTGRPTGRPTGHHTGNHTGHHTGHHINRRENDKNHPENHEPDRGKHSTFSPKGSASPRASLKPSRGTKQPVTSGKFLCASEFRKCINAN